MYVPIDVRNRIYVPNVATGLYEQIKEALTVRREATLDQAAYEKCLLENLSGKNRSLTMPRGFLNPFCAGLTALNYKYDVTDNTSYPIDGYSRPRRIKLRDHQEEAVQAILNRKEGVIVAPPAAGKTVLTLEAIRRLNTKALIIVDKKNLVDQWANRCKEFLGIEPNYIIDGKITQNGAHNNIPITIGMQQTLSSWFVKGGTKYTQDFGFVCLDECHHVSAETYLNVFEKFSARYRIGLSATPYRNDGLDLISQLVIGPVIYRIDSETLIERQYLQRPEINRIKTHFEHVFWGTHSTPAHGICDKPGCAKNGRAHRHRNNYLAVTKDLIEDYDRNYFIAKKIYDNKAKCNLVVSDRLNHLEALKELTIEFGFPEERTHMLTGRETPAQRAEVVRLASYGECAIFSTIAKEALDIPRLDRLYLAWPVKKDHVLEQQIGRITRTHPDKEDAIVYDFVDEACSVLFNQARSRFNYYRQKNYKINEA